jgi:PTS system nitrogen regulatory IIA component
MKPEFLKYMTQDCVITLSGSTKREILDAIVAAAATKCTIEEQSLKDAVWKREKMMTTGVGNGLALPHIRVPGFGAPLVMVGVCETPVEGYASLDNDPIRLVVFVAADDVNQDAYLKLLGSISAKFKQEGIIQEILAETGKPKKIFKILSSN